MKKRMTLNLDLDLVAQAQKVLGTDGTTETIHQSLEAVVRNACLQRLARRRITISEEQLVALRNPLTVPARDQVAVVNLLERDACVGKHLLHGRRALDGFVTASRRSGSSPAM